MYFVLLKLTNHDILNYLSSTDLSIYLCSTFFKQILPDGKVGVLLLILWFINVKYRNINIQKNTYGY